ncbi:MAG: hypothetical protein KJ621_02685, partial [Proteobacteria bacterium]|nr:hypothetical protein [Pseudomonadota bacterium]
MAGRIISQQKCRHCGPGFNYLDHYQGKRALLCACGKPATRHTIRLKYKGEELKVSRDHRGRPFYTYAMAERTLEVMRSEIDAKRFDPSRYKPARMKPLRAENYFQTWLEHERVRLDQGQVAPETLRTREAYV